MPTIAEFEQKHVIYRQGDISDSPGFEHVLAIGVFVVFKSAAGKSINFGGVGGVNIDTFDLLAIHNCCDGQHCQHPGRSNCEILQDREPFQIGLAISIPPGCM
jgi:hypothetical protein